MMNRTHDEVLASAAALTAPVPVWGPHLHSASSSSAAVTATTRQETEGTVMPPTKPIRQATLHSSHEAQQQLQQSSLSSSSRPKMGSSGDLELSFYSSFHLSFSKQDSSRSLTAPSKPVRQATMGTEETLHDDSLLLNSYSLHSSGTTTSNASSSSRFNSLFEIVTTDEDSHEVSLSALRFATTPPSQPVRQVTSGLTSAFALPLAPLELNRDASVASSSMGTMAAKKPRVTNCTFSKKSLLDDDDEDDIEADASISPRANKEAFVLGSSPTRRHHHPSLGMSLSCMTLLQGAASAPSASLVGPPPMPVRQLSSDGHVLVIPKGRRSSKTTRGLLNTTYPNDNTTPPRRLDRLCATESASSASPPARPIRQVSRPMDLERLPQLPPHLSSRSTGSMLIPPSLPRRQVTTQEFVDAAPASQPSSSQSLSRELDEEHAQALPPSKPMRQVSVDFGIPKLVVLREPNPLPPSVPKAPATTTTTSSSSIDARRSKRRGPTQQSARDGNSTALQPLQVPRGGRATSAPLTPLPTVKSHLMFSTRLMSPPPSSSSSSNASSLSSTSSSRSSVARHRTRGDLVGGPMRQ